MDGPESGHDVGGPERRHGVDGPGDDARRQSPPADMDSGVDPLGRTQSHRGAIGGEHGQARPGADGHRRRRPRGRRSAIVIHGVGPRRGWRVDHHDVGPVDLAQPVDGRAGRDRAGARGRVDRAARSPALSARPPRRDRRGAQPVGTRPAGAGVSGGTTGRRTRRRRGRGRRRRAWRRCPRGPGRSRARRLRPSELAALRPVDPAPSSQRSNPAAMTVTLTSSPIASSMTVPKMMLASGWATPWMISIASFTSNSPSSGPPAMLTRMPRAPSIDVSRSGVVMRRTRRVDGSALTGGRGRCP